MFALWRNRESLDGQVLPTVRKVMRRLLGDIAAQADPPEVGQAEGYSRQAPAVADGLGMRPLVAHCHLGLGTLYRRDEQAVGCINPSRSMVASGGDRLVLVDESSQPIATEDLLDRTPRRGEMPGR